MGDFLGGWDFGENGDILDGFCMDFGGKSGRNAQKGDFWMDFGWIWLY